MTVRDSATRAGRERAWSVEISTAWKLPRSGFTARAQGWPAQPAYPGFGTIEAREPWKGSTGGQLQTKRSSNSISSIAEFWENALLNSFRVGAVPRSAHPGLHDTVVQPWAALQNAFSVRHSSRCAELAFRLSTVLRRLDPNRVASCRGRDPAALRDGLATQTARFTGELPDHPGK